jgi:hypothetical protein
MFEVTVFFTLLCYIKVMETAWYVARSGEQYIYCLLSNPKLHRHVFKNPPMDPFRTQINPRHAFFFFFLKITFNVTPRFYAIKIYVINISSCVAFAWKVSNFDLKAFCFEFSFKNIVYTALSSDTVWMIYVQLLWFFNHCSSFPVIIVSSFRQTDLCFSARNNRY